MRTAICLALLASAPPARADTAACEDAKLREAKATVQAIKDCRVSPGSEHCQSSKNTTFEAFCRYLSACGKQPTDHPWFPGRSCRVKPGQAPTS